MNDFWNNIYRYPRFLISSLIGLILTILIPFKNLFSREKFRFILLMFSFLILLILYTIIIKMIGF